MYEKAIYWLLRQRDDDMSVDAWEAFTAWLEADARHGEIYDALVEADGALEDLPSALQDHSQEAQDAPPVAANDNPLTRFIPWVMATAAAVALAIFVWPQGTGTVTTTTIVTGPGEVRTVALTDDITMTVNGWSVIERVDGAPDVTIQDGEVSFAVNGTGSSPLRVRVDDLVLTDIGTEFNVVWNDDRFRVAVAEGIVAINPDGDATEVKAGEAVERAAKGAPLVRREIDPDTVALWREGRLEFDDTPMKDAVDRLYRSAGVQMLPGMGFVNARITGSIAIDGEDEAVAKRFAALVGGETTRREDREGFIWTIE